MGRVRIVKGDTWDGSWLAGKEFETADPVPGWEAMPGVWIRLHNPERVVLIHHSNVVDADGAP